MSSYTVVAFCNQIAVCLANEGFTFETYKTCFIVSRGTELTSLPFLPLFWGESSRAEAGAADSSPDWQRLVHGEGAGARGRCWCTEKVLVPLNQRSH